LHGLHYLRSQYHALRSSIDARIGRVLEHGQYIMGPEVAELEAKLGSSPWPNIVRRWLAVPKPY